MKYMFKLSKNVFVSKTMRGSILTYNRSVAHAWGQMQGNLDKQGVRLSAIDSIIAATAIRHGLAVVTRNTKDFSDAPVRVVDPFQ